jgi:hypothetical protein
MITMRIPSERLQVIVLNSGTWGLNRNLYKANTEDSSLIGALLTRCTSSVQESLLYNNVAIGYRLDNQGIDVRFPARAIQSSSPGLPLHPASYWMGNWSTFHLGQSVWSVKLNTRFHLKARSRMSGAITPLIFLHGVQKENIFTYTPTGPSCSPSSAELFSNWMQLKAAFSQFT